jgi:hypothetical protein
MWEQPVAYYAGFRSRPSGAKLALYGECEHGCHSTAREIMNIVETGNAWGSHQNTPRAVREMTPPRGDGTRRAAYYVWHGLPPLISINQGCTSRRCRAHERKNWSDPDTTHELTRKLQRSGWQIVKSEDAIPDPDG